MNAPIPQNSAERFAELLVSLARWVAIICLIIMTVIIGWQVFGRFVLNDTPKWSEQLAGVLMVYLTLFGAAAAVWDDGLISLDIFRAKLSPKAQIFWQAVSELLVTAFALVMLVYGIQMAALVTKWFIPTLSVPRTVIYVAFPISGAMMMYFALLRLKRFVSSLTKGEDA